MSGLNTDLVSLIVSHLEEDFEALRARALVSVQWVEPAQRLIFQTVQLEDVKRFETLVHILEGNPSLSKHIHNIAL